MTAVTITGAYERARRSVLRPTGKVLPAHQRAHNRSLVLQHLFREGPTSRADLARSTGLTRVTTSDLVSDLLAEGLVEELGQQRGGIGKPATLVGMRTEAFQVVAVDLSSGALMRGAVLTLSGVEVVSRTLDTTGCRGEGFIEEIEEFLLGLVGEATAPVIGVGVGAPGIIDLDGRIIEAPNRDWYDVPLAERLSARLDLPVLVANDADVAVLGEYAYGDAADDCLVITIRQGVGSGMVLAGSPVHGASGAAGEIGHVTVIDDGALCACGRRGCLETVLAAPALRRLIAGLSPDAAEAALRDVGRTLGRLLAPVVSALNVGEVVLCGPPDLLDGALLDGTRLTLAERTMPAVSAGMDVRMSRLGDRVVLMGAASLMLDAILGVS